MSTRFQSLVSIAEQVQSLIDLGVPALAHIDEAVFASFAERSREIVDAVVVVHPAIVAPSRLATVLQINGKAGFVVSDMHDLDEFMNIDSVQAPESPLYLMRGVDRGDQMRNWSPNEALPEIQGQGRTPMTVNEGISWLLTHPDQLQPNHCFMTIGTRKINLRTRKLDARTPAIWISGGTGRDGLEHRNAPKVGWCWAGNRHTWLGFASAQSRQALEA